MQLKLNPTKTPDIPSNESVELDPALRDLRDTAIQRIITKTRRAEPAIRFRREFSKSRPLSGGRTTPKYSCKG